MDGYWELFRRTGVPVFYLLHRQNRNGEARIARGAERTAAEV